MIIDGRKIRDELLDALRIEIESLPSAPNLAILTCAPTFATRSFLKVKQEAAVRIGVPVSIIELQKNATTEACVEAVKNTVSMSDGIVVQLPLPAHIDSRAVVDAVPHSHDVDALLGGSEQVSPPVLGAVQEVLGRNSVRVKGKRCVVVGEGKLVGAPVAAWLRSEGADVTILNDKTSDIGLHTKAADVIVLGAGVPGLLLPDMIREGVVIIDAGTSESKGKLVGDADPTCAERAALFTPVPGGIGPITVAILLKNLIILKNRRR